MLVYCDSVILIYFFDHAGQFNLRATNRLAALSAINDRIAISDLVRMSSIGRPQSGRRSTSSWATRCTWPPRWKEVATAS